MNSKKNIERKLPTNEKDVFKRPLFTRDNSLFRIIVLIFLCLNMLFIVWVQEFNPDLLNEDRIKQIRDKYINTLYLDSDKMIKNQLKNRLEESALLRLNNNKQNKTSAKKSTNEEVKNNPHYGKMKMVILNIGTDFDELIAQIPTSSMSGMIKNDLDAMLDKVLKRINDDMTKPEFDPALDMSYFEQEKLNLQREEIKPTINMDRIETGLLKIQANRSQNRVNKQIRLNEPQLKYCIHKFTRFTLNNKLTITMMFEIDHRGYILRHSVKTIDTNIKDDKLIKCLKRVIGSWKNFGKIDNKENTYTVRQKWIF